jgi:NADH-quinone oxidoreductase subunit L
LGGLLPVDSFLGRANEEHHVSWTLWISLIVALAGFVPAYHFYRHAIREPLSLSILRQKFYVDEFYQNVLVASQDGLGRLADAFEGWVVRGFVVRGSGVVARAAGQGLRLVQCGQVQAYAAVFILGVLLLMGWILIGGGVK